jgi:TolB-like protein/tetratricopeptide (TPR) repeat protein
MSEDTHPSPDPTEHDIRTELDRVLQSTLFLQSDRLARFLRFAIESALAGNTDLLKEYVIGTEVYDRKPPYHPSQDSIVRTEARRLRAKLKEYYESEGKHDPVFIYFRPGAYVPLFRRNTSSPVPSPNGASPENDLFIRGVGVGVAVLPLVDLSHQPRSALCAQGVTEELIHAFTRTDGIRLIARPSSPQPLEAPQDIPSLSQKFGLTTVIEGTVREDGNRLRITVRVLGSDGFQLSSHRFDTEATGEALTQIQELVATAFVSRARPSQSLVRRRKAAPGPLLMAVYPLVLHAETLLDEGSAPDLPASLLKFREATELAPAYARAHTGISHCNLEMALRGAASSHLLVSAAKKAALRAIELDPEMIESWSCLGGAQALEGDWANAQKSFLHGIDLGVHASVSRRYALFLAALGRFDESSHHLAIAQQIDPFTNRQKVARAKFLHLTRQYDEALRQSAGPLLYGPLPLEARSLLALMAAHVGDKQRARHWIESIRAEAAAHLPMMVTIAEVFASIGEKEEAQQIVRTFNLLSLDAAVSRFRQALLSVALADGEQALDFLKLAVEDREAELVWIGVEPRLDTMRANPAFHELLGQVAPYLVRNVPGESRLREPG